jgi:hypothetical protein
MAMRITPGRATLASAIRPAGASAPAIRSPTVRTPGVNRGRFAATSWWWTRSCKTGLLRQKFPVSARIREFFFGLGKQQICLTRKISKLSMP